MTMTSGSMENRRGWDRNHAAGRTGATPSKDRLGAAQPQAVDPSFALRSRLDWTGVRTGLFEVLLTLAATIGFGLGWAAVEKARLDVPPAGPAARGGERPVAAAGLETGYPAAFALGR